MHFLCGEVGSVGSIFIYFQLLKMERVSQHVRCTSHWQMLMYMSNLNFQEFDLLIVIKNLIFLSFFYRKYSRQYYCSFMPHWRTLLLDDNFRKCTIMYFLLMARLFRSREQPMSLLLPLPYCLANTEQNKDSHRV